MRVISKALRQSAKGQHCTLRLEGCLFGSETVVLAHLPCGHKGISMKSPDICACFSCFNCHEIIDRRKKGDFSDSDLLRAMIETQLYWLEKGLMTIKA